MLSAESKEASSGTSTPSPYPPVMLKVASGEPELVTERSTWLVSAAASEVNVIIRPNAAIGLGLSSVPLLGNVTLITPL